MNHAASRLAVLAALSLAAATLGDGRHPRLLIAAEDLPRLRFQCGLTQGPAADPAWGAFGRQAATYQKLRELFVQPVVGVPLPGEVLAAAFVVAVEPDGPGGRGALRFLRDSLASPDWVTVDPLELALAFEWTYDQLPAELRADFLLAARERATTLTPEDSPLEPRRFRERLFGLLLAVGVDETDDPSPSWRAQRRQIIDAAREYLAVTFPLFVRWRGLSPTSPAAGPREELLSALLVELGGHVVNRNLWPDFRASVGRWLEHYVFGTLEHPALNHNFIRDDGSEAPLTPASRWSELLPLTAALIAARTGDPAAASIARRVADDANSRPDAVCWRWSSVAFATPPDAVRPAALPVARNFGGSVVFRGDGGPDATAIWIDAGQPYLRNRQHLDAGHFLIYRGGRLAVSGSQDIALEAVPSKRGEQRLGAERTPFDFDDYSIATIAHNGVVCWDPAFASKCGERTYLPAGGQRCIGGTCEDFKTPLDRQGRLTGRQLAYGLTDHAAFLALDLSSAYEDRVVKHYERRFAFCLDRVLIVIDSVELTSGRSPPTWIINIPARPQVDGRGLASEQRVAGETDEGGIWRHDDARWLRWTDRDGSLWMSALLPAPRRVRIVGGPARSLAIPDGEFAGRSYVGGDPNSFERLIIPGERRGAVNAWYRLGAPTLLGPLFGRTPHWGRVEVEPAALSARTLFVTVLVTDRPDATRAPIANVEIEGDTLRLSVTCDRDTAELDLDGASGAGGMLRVRGRAPFEWVLPTTVEPDPPLAPPSTQPDTP